MKNRKNNNHVMRALFILTAIILFSQTSVAQDLKGDEEINGEKKNGGKKYVTTDEILFDLQEGDVTEVYYKSEQLRSKNKELKRTANEEIILEVSESIDGHLTSLLLELNYLDTSDRFLPDYKNSLHLNMSVDELHFSYIKPSSTKPPSKVYLEMVADFKLRSYYGKELVQRKSTREILLSSKDSESIEVILRKLIKDLFEEFIFSDEVQTKIESTEYYDLQDESKFVPLELPEAMSTVDFERWRTSVATIISEDGHGSACVISADGYLVSNYHVVGQSDTVRVKFFDHSSAQGVVLRKQPDSDLALIKVEKTGLPFLCPADRIGELGDVVYLVGTPADTLLAGSVFKGVLSGFRDFDGAKFIQTDAKVNPGNSGGAMINRHGQLIGIVSSKYVGYGIEGIGFAIPATEIKERLKISTMRYPVPPPPPPPPPPPAPKKSNK